jgi:hypothetical protein
VSRALAAQGKKPKIANIIADPKNPLRVALSGLLRQQILSLLQDTKNKGGDVYAALYELNDPELFAELSAFGKKCHLVLANGAFKPPDNDENKKVRADLVNKVDLHNRLVGKPHFAHNKFVVLCDSSGTPERVLTGSTNWTMTGLCTQANNSLILDDPMSHSISSTSGITSRMLAMAIRARSSTRPRRRSRSMAAASRNGLRPPPTRRISSSRES